MSDCLFCQLIKKQVLNPIYEDKHAVVIKDIKPKAAIHLLIIPRQHLISVNQMTTANEPLIGHLIKTAAVVAKKIKVDKLGYRLVINTNTDAGQTVPHLHIHLLAGEPLGRMNTTDPA